MSQHVRSEGEKKGARGPIAQTVTVVSSIGISDSFKSNFEATLNPKGANSITPAYYDNNGVGYGYGSALGAEIAKFNSGLLVTIGGLVSWDAAMSNAATPFISLIGGTPQIGKDPFPSPSSTPPSWFWGAVSLESYAGNATRIVHLGRIPQGFKSNQICLLYNPNSFMQGIELQTWPNYNCQPAGIDPDGNNSALYYAAAFQSIIANYGTPAVVVSADPFFQYTKDQLVAAANASGLYVCYPSTSYLNAATPPLGATLFGPAIEAGMTALGTMARTVLKTNSAVPIYRVPMGQPQDFPY
jgi:hypothetical protein